jgi:hypothetical protein
MTVRDRQPVMADVWAKCLIGVVCLSVALLGVHVCQLAHFSEGVQNAPATTEVCPVCAVAQSLLFTVFFFLLPLVPKSTRSVIPAHVVRRPFWRKERLWVRPPPAL